jgi:predicted ATPase
LAPGRYEKVFFLECVGFHKDYARIESPEDVLVTERMIKEAYRRTGYAPVFVPVLPVKDRTSFILKSTL